MRHCLDSGPEAIQKIGMRIASGQGIFLAEENLIKSSQSVRVDDCFTQKAGFDFQTYPAIAARMGTGDP